MLIPRIEREKVKYVSFDMLNTYRIVAKHVFPNCICIVDHFHMIQDLNKRVDKVRIRVQKKYKKIKDDLKKKIKNKTITVEEKLELEEASRHYYVLKNSIGCFFQTTIKYSMKTMKRNITEYWLDTVITVISIHTCWKLMMN